MKNRVFQIVIVVVLVLVGLFVMNRSVIRLSTLIGILWPLSIIGIGFIIFMENRSPQSTLAWFLILAFLPAVGVLLYLLFGRSRWRRKNICTGRKNRESCSGRFWRAGV